MRRFARWLGVAIQLLVLGQLLFVAVSQMYVVQTGARIFRYAGF